MAKNKTNYTDQNVQQFLETIENDQQKKDSDELIKIITKLVGEPPKMFGSSIIGFGEYAYKYESGHEGTAPLVGFSPRKPAISFYVYTGEKEQEELLKSLGKYKMGKACIYLNKLSDINQEQLKLIIKSTIEYLTSTYTRIN